MKTKWGFRWWVFVVTASFALPALAGNDPIRIPIKEGTLVLPAMEGWTWSNPCESELLPCYQGQFASGGLEGHAVLAVSPAKEDTGKNAFKKTCEKTYQSLVKIKFGELKDFKFSKNEKGIEFCSWKSDQHYQYYWQLGKQLVSFQFGLMPGRNPAAAAQTGASPKEYQSFFRQSDALMGGLTYLK